MAVPKLSLEEAWSALVGSHTGILTTLRRDGSPVSLPVWFVALDRTICFGTPSRTKKVARIARDARAAFLVESGRKWVDLQAVHVSGLVSPVLDPAEIDVIDRALEQKYAGFRAVAQNVPDATRRHYQDRSFFRLVPEGKVLSWDNSRIPRSDAP